MRLRILKKKYMCRMSVLTVILSVIVGIIYYIYLPHRYFVGFPFIPLYFFLMGWLSVDILLFLYKYRPKFLVSAFLAIKAVKFILSIVFILLYQMLVGHEILAFTMLFLIFYIVFLVFETTFFVQVELQYKSRKKVLKQQQ